MAEVKLTSGKGEMAQRLNDRLRNSGCDTADVVVKHGDGARRTYHNIHSKGQGGADARLNINATADPQKQTRTTR